MNKSVCWFAIVNVVLPLLVGCSTVEEPTPAPQPKKIKVTRPSAILGLAVNGLGDDFAPSTHGQGGDSDVTFTTNEDGKEQVFSVPVSAQRMDAREVRQPRSTDGLPPSLVRNTGTVARGDRAGSSSMVFAVSAAVQRQLATFLQSAGTIHGGSDLFEQRTNGRIRSIDELNSQSWEAHPAIARKDSMELLVFSSDRKSSIGFSAPYSNAKYTDGNGRARSGNADLWYSFRRIGDSIWSEPVNLATAGDSINLLSNEYSPFLYCVHATPHLIFASDRKGSMDLYDAALKIDWSNRVVDAPSVREIQTDSGPLNTPSDEMFPFIPYPHVRAEQRELYFSSNHFSKMQPDSAQLAGFGGLDVYAVTATLMCGDKTPTATPKPLPVTRGSITYAVDILDATTKTRVPQPKLRVERLDGTARVLIDSTTDAYSVTLDSASLVGRSSVTLRSQGASTFTDKPCNNPDPIIVHYNIASLTRRVARVSPRKVPYDTTVIDQPAAIKVSRRVRVNDTIAAGAGLPQGRQYQFAGTTTDNRAIFARDTVVKVDSVPPPISRIKRLTREVSDTVWAYDTTYVRANPTMGLSMLCRDGSRTIAVPQRDTIVRDTIWVYPVRELAPLCVQIFESADSARNVPYFQTAFWEVNTREGYKRHMQRLRKDLKPATWVELNYANTNWRMRSGEINDDLRQRRIREYAEKAELIERNLDSLADRTLSLLRAFWEYDGAKQEAKFIVSMLAYSDIRPIREGRFISDTSIGYVATSYDTTSRRIMPGVKVLVDPNTDLVSTDNAVLSRLRAYFGYRTVLERLERDTLFRDLQRKGLVLLPDATMDPKDYDQRIKTARVVLLAEGRFVDPKAIPKKQGYRDGEDDFYMLDWIRRVDVQVRRVRLNGDAWIEPECCR